MKELFNRSFMFPKVVVKFAVYGLLVLFVVLGIFSAWNLAVGWTTEYFETTNFIQVQ